MPDDGWTSAASTDPVLVANLLVRLKQSTPTRTEMNKLSAAASFDGLVPFRWGQRKARSRPDVTKFGIAKEYRERNTRSPTTPLSWSGGCGTAPGSGSGNVDGCEASSRSKITAAYELASGKKAQRKKVKTYNELKKEECLLLDERINLNRDLATVHATLTHHKMTNHNLKRIKGMNVHSRSISMAVAEHPFVCVPKQTIAATIQGHIVAFKAQDSNNPSPPYFSSENFLEPKDKQSFSLPDLNMLPSID